MNDPSNYTRPYWWQTVIPPNEARGLLANIAEPNDGSGGILGRLGESNDRDQASPSWVQSAMPFGANENVLGLPAQPIDQPWLNPLPNKNNLSAWNTAPAPGVDWLALAGKAIEPLTSYPETYSQMNRESREQMGRGIDQIKAAYEPGVHDPIGFVTGLGNVGLGALGYVASPISAGLRTIVGKPFEETIGIPKEYSEFAASLGIPGLGLRSAFPDRPLQSL